MFRLDHAFFSTSPRKLKDEKTQNSRKKLKTQAQNSSFGKSGKNKCRKQGKYFQTWGEIRLKWQIHCHKYKLEVKKTNLEGKFTKSSENYSKLKGKKQNIEKKLKNSSKKLKVPANPLGLLAENRSKTKACFKHQ